MQQVASMVCGCRLQVRATLVHRNRRSAMAREHYFVFRWSTAMSYTVMQVVRSLFRFSTATRVRAPLAATRCSSWSCAMLTSLLCLCTVERTALAKPSARRRISIIEIQCQLAELITRHALVRRRHQCRLHQGTVRPRCCCTIRTHPAASDRLPSRLPYDAAYYFFLHLLHLHPQYLRQSHLHCSSSCHCHCYCHRHAWLRPHGTPHPSAAHLLRRRPRVQLPPARIAPHHWALVHSSSHPVGLIDLLTGRAPSSVDVLCDFENSPRFDGGPLPVLVQPERVSALALSQVLPL